MRPSLRGACRFVTNRQERRRDGRIPSASLRTRPAAHINFRIENLMTAKPVTLGVISDTHGSMRPEALEALRGSDRILHAGDVGAFEILEALAKIGPVTAVR